MPLSILLYAFGMKDERSMFLAFELQMVVLAAEYN